MLDKINKEWERFRNRLFRSGKRHKQLEDIQNKLENMPYEIYDKITNGSLCIQIPTIKSADDTLAKILQADYSLSRFADGEFGVMSGSPIHFQNRCPKLAQRLKEVIASDTLNLLENPEYKRQIIKRIIKKGDALEPLFRTFTRTRASK